VPVEDPAWQNLDPPQRRQRTLDAVKRLLLRESQGQPLLVVFEDLHWVDGETPALLDSLVESLGSARFLLLVNYRPEYEHRWGSKTAYSQLGLDSLPAESAAELLAALLGPDPRLAPLTQMLVRRGNPFFLEETVRILVETGALAGERGAYRLTRPVEALQVPATVQTILAARIDRLPAEEKRLLQAASVIGKHVPYALLAAIVAQPEETLRRGLAHLQEAEFLYETQLFPDLELTFKHALTHDVAYAGLLAERRRELRAAVAAALERLHGGRLVEHVERLAHHARQGEVWDKAVRYLRQAGAKMFMRSANREAATCFEQALDALRRLPEDPNAIAESLDLRFDLRNALFPLGEGGRMGALLDEAEALAKAVGDQRRLGRALNYKVIQFGFAGDHASAIELGLRALAIGEAQADLALQVVANSYLGRAYVAQGECREGVRHCEAAVALIPEGMAQERFGQAAIQASLVRHHLLHANVWVGTHDRAGLERLCRYILRPPFAQERLRMRGDGRVALELKRAWHDGTRELVFEPLEFLERLATLTPRPEANLLLSHGVLASRARWRARVVAYGRAGRECTASAAPSVRDPGSAGEKRPGRGWTWAALMQRAFDRTINCNSRRGSDRADPGDASLPPPVRAGARRRRTPAQLG
jgi:predicted ATPase